MKDSEFEGTLVLERLASIGLKDEFYDAVDSDNFDLARNLLEKADIDSNTIEIVLQKMGYEE